MNRGCLRPLLYSLGAVALITLGLLAWNAPTVALMLGNMRAMGEGAGAAQALRTPGDVLDYVATHPEQFSLVVYDVERPAEGLYYQAGVARPVAGLPKLLTLAAYAQQAASGRLDSSRAVPLGAVSAYQLPGAGQDAHRRAVKALRQADRLPGDRLTLAQAAWSMMRHGDPAAADFLALCLGPDALREAAERLDLPARMELPLPSSGLFLSWSAPETGAEESSVVEHDVEARAARYRQLPRAAYRRRVVQLADRLSQDTSFRRRVTERRARRGSGLSLRQQHALAGLTFPTGTAQAYAALMARLAADSLAADSLAADSLAAEGPLSSAAVRLMRAHVERPVPGDSAGTFPLVIGSEGESVPGLVSFAGYTRREGGGGRVVALLAEDLPTAVFYHLMQTGLDKGFEVQLLLDDAFFRQARQRLMGRDG